MTREETLDAAKECVCKSREADYSSPENSFVCIANLWNSYLSARMERALAQGGNWIITPKDVGVMMALLKIGRIATGRFKEDSYIDCAGYIACAAELEGNNED